MRIHKKVLWITRTAILIALLVVLQALTVPLGYTIVTGSVVNLMLIISVMTCGPATGLSVAVVAPVMSKLLGIGPFWSLIPFIAAGNIVLVLLWHFIGNRNFGIKYAAHIAALIVGAVGKFLVLYTGVILIAVPYILGLTEQQATVVTSMYSVPQLFTAMTGGVCAIILLPTLKKGVIRKP